MFLQGYFGFGSDFLELVKLVSGETNGSDMVRAIMLVVDEVTVKVSSGDSIDGGGFLGLQVSCNFRSEEEVVLV